MANQDQTLQDIMKWDCGEAHFQRLGGMLGPVRFDLKNGRSVSPLHIAPWENENLDAQPGILRRLRGDWPCVPFGYPSAEPLPSNWSSQAKDVGKPKAPEHPHGFCSNHDWTVTACETGSMTTSIRYPDDNPIESVERVIAGSKGQAEILCSLTITPRHTCQLPLGLHPVFRLPEEQGAMELDVGPHRSVWSHPLDEEGGISLVQPNRQWGSFESLTDRGGAPLSLRRLPMDGQSETLLLLSGVCGRVKLTNHAEGYRVTLSWDAGLLPSLMLWISNRGRQSAPWNGRHLALGLEPVRAAFDLGTEISSRWNPLHLEQVPTAYSFTAGTPLTTQYKISVEPV